MRAECVPLLCVASPDDALCRHAALTLAGDHDVASTTTLAGLIASARSGVRLALVDPYLDGIDHDRPMEVLRAVAELRGVRILLLQDADKAALARTGWDPDLLALVRRVQLQIAGDQQIELLRDATRRLTAIPETSATIGALLDLLGEQVAFDTATLFMASGASLEARAARGYELDVQRLRSFPIGEGIAGWVAAARQPTIVGDSQLDTRFAPADARGSRSLLAVPLLLGTSLTGVVTLVRWAPAEPFVDADLVRVGTLASAAAAALENARLTEHERKLSEHLQEIEATLGRERTILNRLDAYDRSYTQAVATVSHELKTPLTAIRGFAQLIMDGAFDRAETRDFGNEIYENAVRLCAYVDEMLDEDQVSGARVRLRVEPVDVGKLVAGVLRSLGVGMSERHRLLAVIPPGLSPVAGDPERLRQILVNLIGNAIKYSPAGGLIRIVAEAAEDTVVVSVEDEGIGIPVEERERVFDRFYRVQSEASRGIKGTGLGLGLVRQLVDLHGGRVWIEAGPGGHGSAVRVALPRAVLASAPVPARVDNPTASRVRIVAAGEPAGEVA